MKVPGLRSSYEKVGGIVYVGRMFDKIRLHARGALPPDYRENLGVAFDGRCLRFLGVEYPALVARVLQGGADEEILEWCFRNGRRPDEEEIQTWNGFMTRRGWRDEASESLEKAKQARGFGDRADIQTYFDFHRADEEA